MAFSPDGRKIASASQDYTVKLWDVSMGKVDATFQGNSGGVCSVAFSPDGMTLAAGSDDGTIKLWDVVTAKEKTRV